MRTNDGEELKGTTPEAIVSELHRLSRTPAKDDVAFMCETAKRVLEQTGVTVSTAGAGEFVAGLVELGLLIEEGK